MFKKLSATSLKYYLHTKTQLFAIALATSPLLLAFILALINVTYMGRMVKPCSTRELLDCPTQPWGWVMVGVVLLMMMLMYGGVIALSKIDAKPNRDHRLSVIMGLVILGGVFIAYLCALLVVLLGPALLLIIEVGSYP